LTDVVPQDTPRAEPPTTWVEQLDAAIERETNGTGGPLPADLVSSWLAWYAQRLVEQQELHDNVLRRYRADRDRALRLVRQLTTIIVDELTVMTRWDSELQEPCG